MSVRENIAYVLYKLIICISKSKSIHICITVTNIRPYNMCTRFLLISVHNDYMYILYLLVCFCMYQFCQAILIRKYYPSCVIHPNSRYKMNIYHNHAINLFIETDMFNQYFLTLPIVTKMKINKKMLFQKVTSCAWLDCMLQICVHIM